MNTSSVVSTGSRSRLLVPLAFWLGLGAALLALWLSGQADKAWSQVTGARLAPLLLVLGVGAVLPLIHARRWRVLMQAVDCDIPNVLAADVTVSASLVNYAGPGYLGAPAKAYLASRGAGAPWGRTLLTMAFEQGLDFVMLALGSAVALALLGPSVWEDLPAGSDLPVWLLPAAVIGIGAGVALAAIERRRLRRMLARVLDAFRTLGRRVRRPPVAALTVLYWLAQVAVVGLLLWGLRLPITFTSLLALSTLPLLAGQLAPLPGGIGAREAVIVALTGPTDVNASGLLGLAVLQRVLLVAALPLSLGLVRAVRAWGRRR